jgi:hypothetical protein
MMPMTDWIVELTARPEDQSMDGDQRWCVGDVDDGDGHSGGGSTLETVVIISETPYTCTRCPQDRAESTNQIDRLGCTRTDYPLPDYLLFSLKNAFLATSALIMREVYLCQMIWVVTDCLG